VNSHVSAEKAHEPLSKNDVLHDERPCFAFSFIAVLWRTERTTRRISSGLESLPHFSPGFLEALSPWLSVTAPWSCSSQRGSGWHTGAQNSTICTSDPRGDFTASVGQPIQQGPSSACCREPGLWSSEQSSRGHRETALQLAPHIGTFFL